MLYKIWLALAHLIVGLVFVAIAFVLTVILIKEPAVGGIVGLICLFCVALATLVVHYDP